MKSAGDPVSLAGGVLSVHGTDGNDSIVIQDAGQGQVLVTINGAPELVTGPVDRVRAFGYKGDDAIEMFSALSLRAYGHEGDDLLRGGAQADVLSGGAGNDTIYGGPGNDVIYGGLDADEIEGGLGDDWLYGEDAPKRTVWSLAASGWRKVADDLDEFEIAPPWQATRGQEGMQFLVVSV